MKNIVPAVISIIVGFAVSSFALNKYLETVPENTASVIEASQIDNNDDSSNDLEINSNDNSTTDEQIIVDNTIGNSSDKNQDQENKSSDEEVSNDNSTNETTEEETPELVEKAITEIVNIDLDKIQDSYDNWNTYTKGNIDLMSTYIPIDDKGAKIGKGIFLNLLKTGAYIPIKSENKDKIEYKLSTIKESTDEKVKRSIKSKASVAYKYFKMEGKKLPSYNFVDLKGKSHNKADTKGKMLVLKCWFINCKVCVEEFPQLNGLVEKYKNEKIQFVSLAFDEKDKLIEFLNTKDFKYVTIPEQKKYMSKKLKVKQYPTHLIVDANGRIIKMVNNVKTLTTELSRITGK